MLKSMRNIPCRFCGMKKRAAFLLAFAVLLSQSPDAFAHFALSFSPSTVYAHNLNGQTITISRTIHSFDNGYLQAGSISLSGLTGLGNGAGVLGSGGSTVTYTLACNASCVSSITSPTTVTITGKGSGNPRLFFAGGTHSGTLTVNPTPRLSIDSPRVSEGNSGSTMMTFTVSLSPASTQQVTVEYEVTSQGTATIEIDFGVVSSGTLTFAAGDTSKTITVPIMGDTTTEPSETVIANLSVPSNAAFAGGVSVITGTGTIVDDDRVLSSDSSLSSLVLSAGELSPSFSSSTLSYTATVDRSVDRLTVTPTANTAVSGIRVNRQRVSSGSASRSIDLSFGENPISVLVLAENLSYRVYQIVVTREEADRTPDEFSFAMQDDAEPGATVTSEAITVAGLGDGESAEISVSGGTLIVDGSEFSGTTVTNGQQVAVSVVASDESGSTTTATVTIGGVSANFTVTTRDALPADQTPDAFSFAARDSVEPGSRVTSDAVTVSGLGDGVATAISVSGGTLVVDGQGFTGTTVTNGQRVAVSVVASDESGQMTTATVTIGGVSANFTVTTRDALSADQTPDAFSFAAKSGVNPDSRVTSDAVTVSGLGDGVATAISVSGGTLVVDGQGFTGTTVTNGQRVAVTVVASREFGGTATATVTIGGVRGEFTATTRAASVPTQTIEELDREIVTEVSREVASSTLQAIAGRISNAVGNVPVAVPSAGSATSSLLPILEILDRHDRDSSSTRSNLHQSLDGANFVLSLANGEAAGSMQVADDENGMAPGGVAIWGSADYRNMSGGKNSSVSWDGDLFSVHVGTDVLLESGMLIGLSASVSRGSFDYSGSSRNTSGQLKTRMTSLHPYLGWTASERLNLWMTVGYGQGKIEYNDSGLSPSASDTSLTTTAFGSRYRLNDGGFRMLGEAVTVDLKTEAWGTRLTVKGNEARRIRTHGLRFAIEGTQERKMETGATLTPYGELGVRWDGGEGDTGTGLELGGGLKLLAPCLCQTLDASARYLALHESGRKEWGVGMSIRRDLNYDGTGMSYGASLSHGKTGSEVETLWESSVAGRADEADRLATRLATRLAAEVGYGLYGADGIYTPYTGLGLVDNGSRDYSIGIRYTGEAALSLRLDISRFEKIDKSPDHRIMLTGQVDW